MPKMKTCCNCKKRFKVVKPLNFRCALCQLKMSEGAIEATLEQCGGHMTLAVMVVYYNTYADFYEKYADTIRSIQEEGPPANPHRPDNENCPLYLDEQYDDDGNVVRITIPSGSCTCVTN